MEPVTVTEPVLVTSAVPHCEAPATVPSLSNMMFPALPPVPTVRIADSFGSMVTVTTPPLKPQAVAALATGARNRNMSSDAPATEIAALNLLLIPTSRRWAGPIL